MATVKVCNICGHPMRKDPQFPKSGWDLTIRQHETTGQLPIGIGIKLSGMPAEPGKELDIHMHDECALDAIIKELIRIRQVVSATRGATPDKSDEEPK